MGSALSRLRISLHTMYTLSTAYRELAEKLALSPGLPRPNPSTPYWIIPPSSIARHNAGCDKDSEGASPDSHGCSSSLPDYADVVIVGSGITGTAFARTLLDWHSGNEPNTPLKVVMLEARDACSGATARNGGHITPPLYHDYFVLKEMHGASMAQKIIKFRLSHLGELLKVASEENLLDQSQCREVQTFDVFYNREMFELAKTHLKTYQNDMPGDDGVGGYSIIERNEDLQKLQLSPLVVGCICTRAGAIHPYRLVTGILERLLRVYSQQFDLFTHTPCTAISPPEAGSPNTLYTVHTPRGQITTQHVIHCTNAWVSHLLPSMRGKIIPARGNMTAQRPGTTLGKVPVSNFQSVLKSDNQNPEPSSWLGTRSFVFYPTRSPSRWDYLTQQPATSVPSPPPPYAQDSDPSPSTSRYPSPSAELMLGGGFAQGGVAERAFFDEVGNIDDETYNLGVHSYLGGALPVYFGDEAWGEEGRPVVNGENEEPWAKGRVKACWSGIMGISTDRLPWVGRMPETIATRKRKGSGVERGMKFADKLVHAKPDCVGSRSRSSSLLVGPPGEWLSAGYSGEGMVHAFMSGKALAYMVLGIEDDVRMVEWFPDAFRITQDRWKAAKIEDLLEEYGI